MLRFRSLVRPVLYSLLGLVAILFACLNVPTWKPSAVKTEYGVTFSRSYARWLGLDPVEVLRIALEQLKITRFRIPVYWSEVEPRPGERVFADLDHDLAMIKPHQGRVILAIGRRLPRWPECWIPEWAKSLSQPEQEAATKDYLRAVVERYKTSESVIAWQVENEYQLPYFGDCPAYRKDFLAEEIAFVRKLDPTRPIVTTDSGELSTWSGGMTGVNALGVSIYRKVRTPTWIGGFVWPYWFIGSAFYERKAWLLRPFGLHEVYISEFQMEPWNKASVLDAPIAEQFETLSLKDMQNNLAYSQRVHLSAIDFWGLEWWVWMAKTQNHPEFLEMMKGFYTSSTL